MTCKVNADTTNGLKLESDTSGEIDLQTNGTTKVHMDSSGNVGIGTTNPDGALTIQATGASDITYKYTDGNTKAFSKFDNSDFTFKEGTVGNDAYAFFTANTERMRIDSDGFIGIGVTTTQAHLHVDSEDTASIFGRACIAATTADPTGDSLNQLYVAAFTGDSNVTNATFLSMRDSDGEIGNITANGASSVAYNTSSDYRLKENVNYTFDATTRLKQLRPCRFNFIADPDTTKDGFLAHEVSSIVPEAVTGTHDETRECVNVVKKADGKMIHENVSEEDWTQGKTDGTYAEDTTWSATATVPRYQGIDQSKLVPLLVKTIQELEARITALENN